MLIPRIARPGRGMLLGLVAIAMAACGATTSSADRTPAASVDLAPRSPGEALGAFPGVEGFAYAPAGGAAVADFARNADESLEGSAEVRIVDAATAERDGDQVLLIGFTFPGLGDEAAVDAFARVIDRMEDGFGAASERGLGGAAYVLTNEGRSVVMGPWGRTEGLVFLFAVGPTEATTDLAGAILRPSP